jgi:hypothetical protein
LLLEHAVERLKQASALHLHGLAERVGGAFAG